MVFLGPAPGEQAPRFFYHATNLEAALKIQAEGFRVDLSGSNAGARLGPGVYCTVTLQKAMQYCKGPHGGIVFELQVDLGKCKKLERNDPLMTTWQQNGYDSAWAPADSGGSGLEENCIKDSARIRIVRAIAGHTGKLLELGMTINDSGRLVMLADLQASSGDPATVLKKGDCKVCGKPVWSNEGRVKSSDDGSYVHQTCHDASQVAAPEPRDLWSTRCALQFVTLQDVHGRRGMDKVTSSVAALVSHLLAQVTVRTATESFLRERRASCITCARPM